MTYESELNIGLSDLLREKGLASSPEKQTGRKRHDIDIKVGLLNAVIEAEKGQSPASKNSAVREAEGRLIDKTANIALALCYPDGTKRDNLEEQIFEWAVRSPRTLKDTPEWHSGGLDDLATVILQLPNELGNPDALAERLSNSLQMAVDVLSDDVKMALAEALDLPAGGKNLNTATVRALLVVATAIMFHARLEKHLKKPPLSFEDKWPPQTAADCAKASNPPYAYSRAWRTILALDYRPIFETACNALDNAQPSPDLTLAVSQIAEMVLGITGESASLRHDLLGRIFHRILHTARYDGSFYTSTASASLLAALALRAEDADWTNAESIGRLRVIDPACGTGTLLMGVSERARDLVNRQGGMDGLEKILIEQVLHGYDTNLTATHLAATTLGLLAPGTEFAKMNIERTFLGVDETTKHASLGSLEFISGGQPSLLGWAGGKQHIDDIKPQVSEISEFDIVIMNPPFTRDSLRHDQFSRQDEAILKEREKKLFKKHLAHGTLHMSSQGNNFVVLAERLTRDGGTMATVLPMVTATNPSSLGIRRFIADKFHVEKIVISYDPRRQSFSENTNISELLLVCRKHKKNKNKKPTQVFALTVSPFSPAEAMMTANAINSDVEKDKIVKHEISHERMAVGDWLAVQFLSPRLITLFSKLRGGEFFPVKQLSEIGDTLTGQAVRGVFVKKAHAQSHGMIALWYHETSVMTTMSAKHDTYIAAKHDMEKQAYKLWERCGKLMLPARLWLPLTRTPAVLLARQAVGSAWCPFNFTIGDNEKQKELWEKVLCLYLNSSIGILALLGIRDFKKIGYPNFSKDSIGKLPTPDFVNLPPKQVAVMAKAFDKCAKDELQPLRALALCDVRCKIDNAVADALSIDRKVMDELRELLSQESSISGRRYEMLKRP